MQIFDSNMLLTYFDNVGLFLDTDIMLGDINILEKAARLGQISLSPAMSFHRSM